MKGHADSYDCERCGPDANPNTWEYVRHKSAILRHIGIEDIENAWKLLDAFYGGAIGSDDNERTFELPFDAFKFYMDAGLYPPPEILWTIAACFDKYMLLGGRTALEDVFFGKPKKGVGNFSARRSRNRLYERFLNFERWQHLKAGRKNIKIKSLDMMAAQFLSDEEAQGEFVTKYKHDVDFFLRNYRRWKKKRDADK